MRRPLLTIVASLFAVAVAFGAGAALLLGRDDDPAPREDAAVAFVADSRRVADCTSGPGDGDEACLAQAYGNIALRRGPTEALQRLAADATTIPAAARSCHRSAHTIGAAALVRARGDISVALADGDSTCAMGYYHGVLDYSLAGDRSRAAVMSSCDDAPNDAIGDACAHGVGHALMLESALDAEAAIEGCRQLPSGRQRRCVGGVYMEAYSVLRELPDGVERPTTDAPCRAAAAADRPTCERAFGGGAISGVAESEWPRTALRCDGLQPTAAAARCWTAVGEVAAETAGADVASVVRACQAGRSHAEACIAGAAYFARSPWGIGEASLCSAAPVELRAACTNVEHPGA